MRILKASMSLMCLVSTFLVIMAVLNGFAKPAEPANFVLILCGDMGRSDIGCYGARSTRRTSTDLQRGDAVHPVLKQRQVYHHAGIDPDRTEMSNLAQAKPDLAKRLAGDWGEWAKRTGLRR